MKAQILPLFTFRDLRTLLLGASILLMIGLTACSRVAQPTSGPSHEQTTAIAAKGSLQSATPQAGSGEASEGEASGEAPPPAPEDWLELEHAPRYEIDLVIDFEAHAFQGRAQVDYTNNEDVALERLYFRLLPNGGRSYGEGTLGVSKTLVNDQPAEIRLSSDDTILEIELPSVLEPGERLQLDFEFNGVTTLDFGEAAEAGGYGIYNLSGDVLALSGWYPILAVYDEGGWNLDPVSKIGDSVYSDTAFYTVEVSLPSELTVAATGVETARQANGQGTRMRFESGPARDFFLVASPDFRVKSQVIDGIKVNSYYLPEHAAGGSRALSVAVDSLHIFNQKFGPYPGAELDVVEAPMQHALGVEYPGIFLVNAALYGAPERAEFIVTTAHEVAHQWWYNAVGNDVFDEPWLDEALATYSSSLYYEFRPGGRVPDGLIEYWRSRYERVLSEGKDNLITESLAHFESLGDAGIYGGVVYNKGALFFHALREQIGDRAFFQALQNYYQSQQYQIATTDDLLTAFEETSGQDLDLFYQEWLYSKETE